MVGGGFIGSFLTIWLGSLQQRRLAFTVALVEITLVGIF